MFNKVNNLITKHKTLSYIILVIRMINLIIGVMDQRMKKYITNNTFDGKVKIIYKMCDVKTIKDEVRVIIPFGFILDTGLISNTFVHFYELLMSINVKEIIYSNSYNDDKLFKIANEFNIPIKKLESK